MRIKKFFGPDMKNVTEQMKQDLGPDAIILNTRRLKKPGVLGALGKDTIEVTAAIDEQLDLGSNSYTVNAAHRGNRKQGESFESLLKNTGIQAPSVSAYTKGAETVEGLRQVADHFEKRNADHQRPVARDLKEFAEIYQLKSEVEDIKVSLSDIANELRYKHTIALPDHLRRAYATLVDNDVSEPLAAELMQSVYKSVPTIQLERKDVVDRQILDTIARLVKTGTTGKAKSRRPKVVALVGPTGVGKTTTIAKLAAIQKLVNQLNVGLITADTYRIGAIEQLRTFAAIADIPMEVVYRPAEMGAALKKFSGKDIVFIDTVGRNQRSKKDLAELRKFIDAARPDEVHLVLSASTSTKGLADVVDKFKALHPDHVIFSKIDEAVTFGPLFNIAQKHNVHISYLTTGQAVPDDILPADGIKFASLVYDGEVPNA
jgi:flagellar biosynthesis protein FlhF